MPGNDIADAAPLQNNSSQNKANNVEGASNLPMGNNGGNALTQPVNMVIPSATVVVPSIENITTDKVTQLPLTPTQRVGYQLSKFILWIICGCLALLFGLLIFNPFDAYNSIKLANPVMPDSVFNHQKEIIKALQEEKKSYRDFVTQISQMILLNLLLPTLTAVLGYIFGSKESAAPQKDQ